MKALHRAQGSLLQSLFFTFSEIVQVWNSVRATCACARGYIESGGWRGAAMLLKEALYVCHRFSVPTATIDHVAHILVTIVMGCDVAGWLDLTVHT